MTKHMATAVVRELGRCSCWDGKACWHGACQLVLVFADGTLLARNSGGFVKRLLAAADVDAEVKE